MQMCVIAAGGASRRAMRLLDSHTMISPRFLVV